jgi:flagellar biosynthesis component FlhA
MIEGTLPQVAVLAYNEIVADVTVEAVTMIGMNG